MPQMWVRLTRRKPLTFMLSTPSSNRGGIPSINSGCGSDWKGLQGSFNGTGAIICFFYNIPGHWIAQCNAKAAAGRGCGFWVQWVATVDRSNNRSTKETQPVFKLLGGASEIWHPSTPSQLYLAITSIFSFTAWKVKEYLHPNQPYVNVQIGSAPAAAPYDSGANISCMSEGEFQKIPVDKRPAKVMGPLAFFFSLA